MPRAAPRVVARDDELRDVVTAAARAGRVAVDVEASGMFAYRARPCTVQLAWDDGGQVAVVDTLATSIAPLGELLGPDGPVKIVHDVAFDARLLAESGIALANVHDTAVAARMLSRLATGLATLLDAELGVHIGKTMQQHDWRLRPLDDRMLEYLAADVVHLEALEQTALDRGFRRARNRGRGAPRGDTPALSASPGQRLARRRCSPEVSRPSVRPAVEGAAGRALAERELAVLRVAAELRELEAERRDVPPHKIASADTLLAPRGCAPEDRARARSAVRGVATRLCRRAGPRQAAELAPCSADFGRPRSWKTSGTTSNRSASPSPRPGSVASAR